MNMELLVQVRRLLPPSYLHVTSLFREHRYKLITQREKNNIRNICDKLWEWKESVIVARQMGGGVTVFILSLTRL